MLSEGIDIELLWAELVLFDFLTFNAISLSLTCSHYWMPSAMRSSPVDTLEFPDL
jgi:hypothetical protein